MRDRKRDRGTRNPLPGSCSSEINPAPTPSTHHWLNVEVKPKKPRSPPPQSSQRSSSTLRPPRSLLLTPPECRPHSKGSYKGLHRCLGPRCWLMAFGQKVPRRLLCSTCPTMLTRTGHHRRASGGCNALCFGAYCSGIGGVQSLSEESMAGRCRVVAWTAWFRPRDFASYRAASAVAMRVLSFWAPRLMGAIP